MPFQAVVVLREAVLPFGEPSALFRVVRRTRLVRVGLGLVLGALLVAAVIVARSRDARPDAVLPAGTTGMLVLDLSASAGVHPEIAELLRRVASANEPTGVVVFSDVAYELVPPGTPGRELEPMIRYFLPRGEEGGDPWSSSFSAGTRLSGGVEAAQAALERDGVERGSILVASDLEVFADDIARLRNVLLELRRDGVELRIMPLAARAEQRRLFERIVGSGNFVEPAAYEAGSPGRGTFSLAEEATPWSFLALAALLSLLLAANERYCGRLRLPATGRPQ
jgi:hypothetical protein